MKRTAKPKPKALTSTSRIPTVEECEYQKTGLTCQSHSADGGGGKSADHHGINKACHRRYGGLKHRRPRKLQKSTVQLL